MCSFFWSKPPGKKMTRLLNTQLQHIKVRYSKYNNRNIIFMSWLCFFGKPAFPKITLDKLKINGSFLETEKFSHRNTFLVQIDIIKKGLAFGSEFFNISLYTAQFSNLKSNEKRFELIENSLLGIRYVCI